MAAQADDLDAVMRALRPGIERAIPDPVGADRSWWCDRPICDGQPHDRYDRKHARDTQRPPPGQWTTWLVLAGRGFGKTRTGAEWVKRGCREILDCRAALVAATFTDGRDTMVEGESGILSVLPPSALRGGSVDTAWNRSHGELFFANGSRAKVYSSEKPGRLRGPQHHLAWGDEPAEWEDANDLDSVSTRGTTWSNLLFGLRLGADPRIILTGTPKSVQLIRALLFRDGEREKGPAPDVVVTTGSTYDNLPNLAPTFQRAILDAYEGTLLGQQELHAKLLESNPRALWSREQLQRDRVKEPPDLTRIAVGVDPSGGAGEVGIVVVGKAGQRDGYVLEDRSGHYTPEGWGRAAVLAWHDWRANAITVEVNFGGDMAKSTIQVAAARLIEEHAQLIRDGSLGRAEAITAAPQIKVTHSSRGKQVRAEPISAASEQGRIHMVGMHARLEDQLVDWVPGESDYSPDRLDAMVFAAVELGLGAFSGQARFGGRHAAATVIGR